jgi:hypothetical protein
MKKKIAKQFSFVRIFLQTVHHLLHIWDYSSIATTQKKNCEPKLYGQF